MRTMNSHVVAVLIGLSIGAVATPVSAQDTPERDAAIARCVKQAQTQWPNDSGIDEQRNRTATYKACMTAAGQRP